MTEAPTVEAMNRDDKREPPKSDGMKRKEARGARLQEQVEKERAQKAPLAAKKQDDSTPNPYIDAIGNVLCCFGYFDKKIERGQLNRHDDVCDHLGRCCCCVSASSS